MARLNETRLGASAARFTIMPTARLPSQDANACIARNHPQFPGQRNRRVQIGEIFAECTPSAFWLHVSPLSHFIDHAHLDHIRSARHPDRHTAGNDN